MKRGLRFILAALVLIGAGAWIVVAFMEGRKEIKEEQELENPITSIPRVSVQDGETVVALDTAAQFLGGIEVSEWRGSKIPDSAVIHLDGREWVYLKKDSERFVTKETSSATQFVRKEISPATSLKVGDLIVVTGAQLILSEEFRAQISSEE